MSSQPFPLLDLPKELRLMIYEQYLTPQIQRYTAYSRPEGVVLATLRHTLPTAILRTCRLIKNEAEHLAKKKMDDIILAARPGIYIKSRDFFGCALLALIIRSIQEVYRWAATLPSDETLDVRTAVMKFSPAVEDCHKRMRSFPKNKVPDFWHNIWEMMAFAVQVAHQTLPRDRCVLRVCNGPGWGDTFTSMRREWSWGPSGAGKLTLLIEPSDEILD